MRTLVICALAIAVLNTCTSLKAQKSRSVNEAAKQEKLDGAYEFVSETIELTKPKPTTERLAAPKWAGLWLFHGDRFSQTMMKKGRGYLTYPKNHADLGYESSAGTFVVKGNIVRLERELSLHPLSIGRSMTLEYRFEGDKLILVERMHPYTENVAEGTRTIVLKKIS